MKKVFSILLGKAKDIESEYYRFNVGFFKAIGAVLLWFLTSIIIQIVAKIFSNNNDTYLILYGIIELLTLPLVIALLVKVFAIKTFERNIFKKTNKKKLIYLALLIISFRILYNSLLLPFILKIPVTETTQETFDSISSNIIFFILSACICAPIIEEVLMRGIILNGFLNRFNPSFSIFLSSLIFAIIHFNLPQGINAFILGSIIGYIFYKTRSLYLCMFCHFINNSIAIFIPYYTPSSIISFFIFNAISFIICIPIIILIKRNLNLEYEQCFEYTEDILPQNSISTENYYGVHYENDDNNLQQ